MRPTEGVLENYKTYNNKVSVRYTADGKLDAEELDMLFKAVMANQTFLALAIRDVYEAVTRVEEEVRRLHMATGRGPIGL
jgi:hypothetical protein